MEAFGEDVHPLDIFQFVLRRKKVNVPTATLPETNTSPLKIGQAPKGNDRIPTIHFQVLG